MDTTVHPVPRSPGKRRYRTLDEKRRIVEETLVSETSVAIMARRHCRAALKSRTEADGRKKDSVTFVLISRTNFSGNFVRVLSATVQDFSAVTMQLNPGKGLKTNKRDSGI